MAGRSVECEREDQVDGGSVAGFAPYREPAREVVEDVEGAHCTGQRPLVGRVEVAPEALAQCDGRTFASFAPEREFVQPDRRRNPALAAAGTAGKQRQPGFLQQCGLGTATG